MAGCQHGRVLVRALFRVADGLFLLVASHGMAERGERALLRPFDKGTNPIHEGSTVMT